MKKEKGLAFEASKASERGPDGLPTLSTLPTPAPCSVSNRIPSSSRTSSPSSPKLGSSHLAACRGPAGHQALFGAARAAGSHGSGCDPVSPSLGDENGWRAWLEGFVSPADLLLAQRRLAEFQVLQSSGVSCGEWVRVGRRRWWRVLCFLPRATGGDVSGNPRRSPHGRSAVVPVPDLHHHAADVA